MTTNNQSGTPTVPVPGIRRLRYEPALDGIRGVGAILVFIVHLGMVVPDTPSMATIVPGAYVFMDVFFVVSGFLITGLLLGEQAKAGRLHVPRFYKRRALRLLPALWAMPICHVIWAGIVGYPVVGGWNVERDSLLLAAIHGLNFRLDTVLAPVALGLPHLWSLAIEEQFYIVWPFVVMLLLPVSRSLQRTVAYLLGHRADRLAPVPTCVRRRKLDAALHAHRHTRRLASCRRTRRLPMGPPEDPTHAHQTGRLGRRRVHCAVHLEGSPRPIVQFQGWGSPSLRSPPRVSCLPRWNQIGI